jgi:hypothetical protein
VAKGDFTTGYGHPCRDIAPQYRLNPIVITGFAFCFLPENWHTKSCNMGIIHGIIWGI